VRRCPPTVGESTERRDLWEAGTARQVIALAQQLKTDLAILDITMSVRFHDAAVTAVAFE
jgi:hypothetical protein